MTATADEARDIVRELAGKRVRVVFDDHVTAGRLRPGIGGGRFRVYGRPSNWRDYAEPFRNDPAVYAKALRSASRPELIYILAEHADRIEVVP